jgi:hypothetical protein
MLMRALPVLLWLSWLPLAWAEPSTFELTDGSVVTGELLGVDADGFRVRSATLGELTIDASRVRVMRQGPPQPSGADAGGPADPGLAAMQQQMAGDPQVMGLIMQLRDDPQMARALADPAFLNAVSGGNLTARQDDPRIQELMDNPIVRSIIERMTAP